MTRYELFEAWLTTEEWKEWKKHSVRRFKQLHSLSSMNEARERRKQYLNTDVSHLTFDRRWVLNDWDSMTNIHLRWTDTAQGHSYWSDVNMRTEPIIELTPQRTISNTPN